MLCCAQHSDREHHGVVPRALEQLLAVAAELEGAKLHCSFLEVRRGTM